MLKGLVCLYLHQIEHLFPICLESEDRYPHNARDPIIKVCAMRHRLFFWRNVCYHIVHWFVFFCVKNMQWLFYNFFCLKQEKSLLWDIVQLIVILFVAEFVVCFIVFLSLFWWSCIEALLCNKIVTTVKHVLKRNLTCLNQIFNCFFLIIFIMYPQYFLSRRASTLAHPHCRALLLLTM